MKTHYHFSRLNMEDMLFELSADQLKAVSSIFRDFADRALSRAFTLDERRKMQNRTRQKIEEYRHVPEKIIRALENGAELDSACAQIDAEEKAPEGFALAHWNDFIRSSNRAFTARRYQLIYRYAEVGYSNEEIGHKLGLHPNSVSRILRKQIQKRAKAYKALTR